MTDQVVVWACLGGAVVVVLVLLGLRIGRTARADDDPGRRAGAPDDVGRHDPHADGLDPDDEKVALTDRRRYPSRKWDPEPTGSPATLADDADDADDEDDRPPTDRPRHPANRWEREDGSA